MNYHQFRAIELKTLQVLNTNRKIFEDTLLDKVNSLGPGKGHERLRGWYDDGQGNLVVDAFISWGCNEYEARYTIPTNEV